MNSAIAWFKEYGSILSVVANLGILLVWVLYAQLFYRDYTRRRRPRIIIHHAPGQGFDSACLLINMSQETIHIIGVLVVVHTTDGSYTRRVSDYYPVSADQYSLREVQSLLKQGPLSPGSFLLLGTYGDLLQNIAPGTTEAANLAGKAVKSDDTQQITGLEIKVVAVLGGDDRSIGASRAFSVTHNDGAVDIRPQTLYTQQLAGRKQRPLLDAWLRECMNLNN